MKTRRLRFGIVLTAAFVPGVVMAQYEAHQGGASQTSAQMAPCAQVQSVVDNIIAAAMARLESARLSNSAAEMRAAVDSLEGALRDVRTQLSRCAGAAAAPEPQAGHTMPGMQPPVPTTPPAPMDHSKMPMGGTPTTKPGAGTGTKPATSLPPMDHSKMPMGGGKPGAATGTKPATPVASMDHSKMQMGEANPGKVMDPVNGLMVDPTTAVKTTHQGQTYYFSSELSRKEFLENPAKFAKKPKG